MRLGDYAITRIPSSRDARRGCLAEAACTTGDQGGSGHWLSVLGGAVTTEIARKATLRMHYSTTAGDRR